MPVSQESTQSNQNGRTSGDSPLVIGSEKGCFVDDREVIMNVSKVECYEMILSGEIWELDAVVNPPE